MATREVWLADAIDAFRPRFESIGAPLPERIRVTVGFAFGAKKESPNMPGECWARTKSADDTNHIFIAAEIGDPYQVLVTLLHQLVHAADDCRSGHRRSFQTTAVRLGLMSPMSSTPPTPAVGAELRDMANELGDYPHEDLQRPALHSGPPKVSGSRNIKISCPRCGYPARTTRIWLTKGFPICPTCNIRFRLARDDNQ